jgi:glutamine amidotransferase-like uncharacterized protein
MLLELVASLLLGAIARLAEPAAAPAASAPVRVAMFDGRGVSRIGFEPARNLLVDTDGLDTRVARSFEIREGVLSKMDVVVFMGGSGSRQGEALRAEGRQNVRDFVAAGGGYVGVCAGAYLAMQGEEEFFKLAIISGRNLSGDFWKRGVAAATVRAGKRTFKLHFANGPVFEPVDVDGLPPYVTLATYESDLHASRHGTEPGQMPGTPAILATSYGKGRILLFGPNPVLGPDGVAHPRLLVQAVKWVAEGGPVPAGLGFADVFGET